MLLLHHGFTFRCHAASATQRDKQCVQIKGREKQQTGKKEQFVSVRADKSLKIQLALSVSWRGGRYRRGVLYGNCVRQYPEWGKIFFFFYSWLLIDRHENNQSCFLVSQNYIWKSSLLGYAHIWFSINKSQFCTLSKPVGKKRISIFTQTWYQFYIHFLEFICDFEWEMKTKSKCIFIFCFF